MVAILYAKIDHTTLKFIHWQLVILVLLEVNQIYSNSLAVAAVTKTLNSISMKKTKKMSSK